MTSTTDLSDVSVSAVGGTVVLSETDQINFLNASAAILNVTAGGDITDSGAINISTALELSAAGFDITLNTATNDFDLVLATGDNVTLVDANAIRFGATSAGNLTLTTGATVGQSSAVSVSGATVINAGSNVTLNDSGNDFGSFAVVMSTDNASITVRDQGDLVIGGVGGVGPIVPGRLEVTTGGNITQSGAIVNKLGSVFNAGGFDVTLNNASNVFFDAVNATGGSVTLRDQGVLVLGTTTAAELSVTAPSGITDSGVINVTGTTLLSTTNANITLDEANLFGTVNASAGTGTVTLNDADSIDLGTTTAAELNVTAVGQINDSGVINVTGTTLLSTTDSNITLDEANLFGTVNASAGTGTVTLNDADSIILGTTTAAELNVTAVGQINDSGVINVTGTTLLSTTDSNITLDEANLFGTVNASAGTGTVTLNDADSIDLGTTTAAELNVTAVGQINDSGVINVTGTTLLSTTDSNITLDEANLFGTVNASAGTGTVTLNDADSIILGTTTAAELNVTAVGQINDSGVINVTGTTLLSTTDSNITLDEANLFGTVNASAGTGTVTLNDADSIILGTTTAAELNVTAVGQINDSGVINVTGTTLLSTTDSNITLDEANLFGTVNASAGTGTVTLNDADSIILGTTTAAELNVTAVGQINDSGVINVTGTTLLSTTDSNITLDEANLFGTVNASAGTGTVTLNDADSIILGTTTAAELNVTAVGQINDSGVINVTGTTLLSTTDSNITLDEANLFGTVNASAGTGTVTLNDADSIILGTTTAAELNVTAVGQINDSGVINVTGTTLLSTTDSNITLDEANLFGTVNASAGTGTVTLNDADSIILGTTTAAELNVTAVGQINDSGVINVTGTTLLSTTDSNITLDEANLFGTVNASAGTGTVTLNDADSIILGTTTAAELNVTAVGQINDSGVINVTGTTLLSTTDSNITLDEANLFGTVNASAGTGTVTLNDADSIILGTTTAAELNVTAVGQINDSGVINVTGTTLLSTTDSNITLDEANLFGTVNASAGTGTVTLNDADSIILGTTTAAELNVTAVGQINDSGVINVTGTTLLSTTDSNITLDEANLFGTVNASAGTGTVTLNDADSIILGTTTAAELNVTAVGQINDSGVINVTGTTLLSTTDSNITLDEANLFGTVNASAGTGTVTLNDADSIILGTTTAAELNVTAVGQINDSGVINVTGTTLLSTTDSNITLDEANLFGTVNASAGTGTVTLNDADSIILGTTTAAELNVTAVGQINDSGVINVTGTTLLSTTDSNITLDEANLFGTVNASAGTGTVTLNDSAGTLVLGTTTAGNLSVTAVGAVTDSGVINVSGTTTLNSTSGNIDLDSANELGTVNANASGAITLNDATGLTVSGITTSGGTIDVTAGGNLTVSGAVNGTGQEVILEGTNVTLSAAVTGANVTLAATAGDLALQNLTVTTDLDATATGNITQVGALTASGTTTLNATGGFIDVSNSTNAFGTVSANASGAITIADTDALTVLVVDSTNSTVSVGSRREPDSWDECFR